MELLGHKFGDDGVNAAPCKKQRNDSADIVRCFGYLIKISCVNTRVLIGHGCLVLIGISRSNGLR